MKTLGTHTHRIYRYPARAERPQEWTVPRGTLFHDG